MHGVIHKHASVVMQVKCFTLHTMNTVSHCYLVLIDYRHYTKFVLIFMLLSNKGYKFCPKNLYSCPSYLKKTTKNYVQQAKNKETCNDGR